MKKSTLILITVFQVALLLPLHAQQSPRSNQGQSSNHAGLTFRLLPKQPRYRRGEKVSISVSVSNEGSQPIYVARDLEVCPTYWGGIFLGILDSRGREVPQTPCGDPYPLDPGSKGAVRPLAEDLILLGPGYSYSLIMKVEGVPLRPGHYTLTATLIPASLTEEQKKGLAALPYPVFLGQLTSHITIAREQ